MEKCKGAARLTHESLITFMAEAAAIINARPLVPVPNDPEELLLLTPATLLTQKTGLSSAPPGGFDAKDLYKRQWRQVQSLANTFWDRWHKLYLSTLQPRTKWQSTKPNLNIGDLVLVKDCQIHRNQWPLGLVTATFPSKDGNVRKVELRMTKENEPKTFSRPVSELVLLLPSEERICLQGKTLHFIPLAIALPDGNQGKHRVTKRGPALSYPMFTLVTGDLGIVGRWRAVCVTALQRPNSDAAAIRIVVDDRLLSIQTATSTSAPASHPPPRLAKPPRYNGDPKSCRGFLNQCRLHFELLPQHYPTDRSKVAFLISHLEGDALAWVNPLWERNDPLVSRLSEFLETFRLVFDEPGRLAFTTEALFSLHQGSLSVGQYAIQFRTLSSDLGWNNEALVGAFWRGLSGRIKDELAGRDTPTVLEELISLATRIDLRFQERTRERRSLRPSPATRKPLSPQPRISSQASAPEPMQVDRLKMSEQRLKTLEAPVILASVDGKPLQETITQVTLEVELQVGALHKERIAFYVLAGLSHPMLLGLPWLRNHEPILDWRNGNILRWGEFCRERCLLPVRPVGFSSNSSPFSSLPALPCVYSSFSDVFNKKEAEGLPPHRPYDCPIDLVPGSNPPRGRIYPLSPAETQAMSEYIQENLAKGFIRKSSSPAGAGFFFVKKKDSSLRPCIDYRGLNNITVKNKYPLPLIPELFDRLRGAQIFTKLDLRGAYNLVRIRAGDEWKTAFNTRDGHYEYLVMPFGLCNAPAVFQEFVNDVFRDLLYSSVVVYLDDILIFSPDLSTHRRDVRRVLQRLRENHLFAKIEKCVFEQSSLPFLGYMVSRSGLEMDPEKVSAVLNWPRPLGTKAIQRFLGFANYYRQFIPHFSSLTKPISALVRKGVNSSLWTPEAEESFLSLKQSFATAPVLHRPDANRPFVLEVDASSIGAGAVLLQKSSSGRLVTCVFFSKTFSAPERNYSIGDKELLAIKLALEEWRYLLEGSLHPFTIYTDHKNLAYIHSAQRLNPRQARWSLFFGQFEFELHFRPGNKNVKADALSRSFLPLDIEDSSAHFIDPAKIVTLAPLRVISTPPGKTLVANQDKERVLRWGHSSKIAGHVGVKKTLSLVSRHYWWPSLRQDVTNFIASCPSCAKNKVPRQLPSGLLHPLPVPSVPWSHIAMDFITDLPCSSNCSVILVVVDRFSKMSHFIALPGLPSAPELTKIFLHQVFRLHGFPHHIVSDRGVQFTSHFWRALCSLLKVNLDFSSAYHPQSNGQVERVNQVLTTYLRHFSNAHQDDWVSLLPWAEFSYNNLPSESSSKTPFFVVFGQHPNIPLPVSLSSGVPAADFLSREFSTIWNETKVALERASLNMKKFADKRHLDAPPYSPGDKVWLSSRYIKLKIPSCKLGPRYIGPFPILSRINDVSYKLKLPASLRIPNAFHVSLLKPAVFNHFHSATSPSPQLCTSDGIFNVKDILAKKVVRALPQCLQQSAPVFSSNLPQCPPALPQCPPALPQCPQAICPSVLQPSAPVSSSIAPVSSSNLPLVSSSIAPVSSSIAPVSSSIAPVSSSNLPQCPPALPQCPPALLVSSSNLPQCPPAICPSVLQQSAPVSSSIAPVSSSHLPQCPPAICPSVLQQSAPVSSSIAPVSSSNLPQCPPAICPSVLQPSAPVSSSIAPVSSSHLPQCPPALPQCPPAICPSVLQPSAPVSSSNLPVSSSIAPVSSSHLPQCPPAICPSVLQPSAPVSSSIAPVSSSIALTSGEVLVFQEDGCCLAALARRLYGPGTSLYFHIGETEKKCFIEEIPDETMVIGAGLVITAPSYMTSRGRSIYPLHLALAPHYTSMFVEVKDPDDKVILSRQYGSEGRFTFTSHTPGEHQICLHSNSTKFSLFAGGMLDATVVDSLTCWGREFQRMGDIREKSWRRLDEERISVEERRRSWEDRRSRFTLNNQVGSHANNYEEIAAKDKLNTLQLRRTAN
ncbi:unnamed protein product [Ranitomeya imitator]|uniref:Gypsy retrotransposon integrase-like protein 1 n=1 Tax=Ranitomeya imitator TaxID=111125 RepID=A0ABN9LAI3_9NEOB|nr:unnamed protein product [Ranitomeya imitator]